MSEGYSAGSGYLRITNASAIGSATVRVGGQNCTTQFQLDGSAGNITIASSNPFVLNGRGATHAANLAAEIVNVAGNNTINSDISTDSGGRDYLIQSDAGNLTLNTITCGNSTDRYIYLQGAGNGEVTGIITGTAGTVHLIKDGSGTWTLDGNNTYNSDTTVSGGALRLKNNNALGSGASTVAVTVAGGTATSRIELDGSSTPLSITRAITLQGRSPASTHLLNVAGNNAISGDISLVVGGDQYVIESAANTLTLNTITNNTASTTPRYLTLQGAGNGQVGGIIGNATGTTGA